MATVGVLDSYNPIDILTAIINYILGLFKTGAFADFLRVLPYYLINFFAKYIVFSFVVTIVLVFLVVLYARKYEKLKYEMLQKIIPQGTKESTTGGAEIQNPKWLIIEEHINSDDPDKWKLAILEGDIVLGELLTSLNLPGEGIGEKLKAVEPNEFDTLDMAWEAHKIRNAIAHEGSDFKITQREAKRIIDLFKKVFEEFDII
jgi:hypothetical protein